MEDDATEEDANKKKAPMEDDATEEVASKKKTRKRRRGKGFSIVPISQGRMFSVPGMI